jgi:hypothetical protein
MKRGMVTLSSGFRRDDGSLTTDDGIIDPLALDLMDIAGSAYRADRDCRRGSPDSQGWRRPLTLTAQVRHLEVWQRPDVQEALLRVLVWLTDDEWALAFGPYRSASHNFYSIPLFGDDPVDEVCLFSGGLDATAGVASLLAANRSVAAVGVVTNSAMKHYQGRVLSELGNYGRVVFKPVDFVSETDGRRDEQTRRTRGLLFLAFGIAAAIGSGLDRLLMCENGIGAINLPYTSAQWGVMTSRSAHPKTLILVESLATLIFSRPFEIRNPHVAQTKGEMCQSLPDWAREACGLSESCDNAAAGRGALERRCGECTSCLLRRISFHAANRDNWDKRRYRADVKGTRPAKDRSIEMLWQAAALDSALRDPNHETLLMGFPALREVPTSVLNRAEQRRLLAAYVNEWRRYPLPQVSDFLDVEALEL